MYLSLLGHCNGSSQMPQEDRQVPGSVGGGAPLQQAGVVESAEL